jgi:protein-tyrosine phosphatase
MTSTTPAGPDPHADAQAGPGSGPVRWLDLEGALNVRDVGGKPAGPHFTAPDALYRGDNVDDLTPRDVEVLVAGRGLRAVIDLRSPVESVTPPAWIAPAGVEYHRIPLLDLSGETLASVGAAMASDVEAAYRTMAERAGPGIAQVVSVLTSPVAEPGPVLVHCAAGKDRTGIVVAVILAALGVPDEFVVADYMATAERLAAVRAALSERPPYRDVPRDPARPEPPPLTPVAIEAVLRALRGEPGGARGYLARWGVAPDQQARLEQVMLTPPGELTGR